LGKQVPGLVDNADIVVGIYHLYIRSPRHSPDRDLSLLQDHFVLPGYFNGAASGNMG